MSDKTHTAPPTSGYVPRSAASLKPVKLAPQYNKEYQGDCTILVVCEYDSEEDLGFKANEDILRAASPSLKGLINRVKRTEPLRRIILPNDDKHTPAQMRAVCVDDDCGDLELFLRFLNASAFPRQTYSARDLLRIADMYDKYQMRGLSRSSLKRYVDAHAERLVTTQSAANDFHVRGFVVLSTLADQVRSGTLWRRLLLVGEGGQRRPPISGYFNPWKLSHDEVCELGHVFRVLVFVENERANAVNHDVSGLQVSFTKEGEMYFYWADEPHTHINI